MQLFQNDHVTGSITQTVSGTGVLTISYWVGIRTPAAGSALQARLESEDSLTFPTTQTSAILPGSAAGAISGSFVYECADSFNGQFFVDSLGLPVEYDWKVQTGT